MPHVIEKCIEIDAGHRVPYHKSKCRNLHGHRYRIVAVCAIDSLPPDIPGSSEAGMVIDFGDLKAAMEEVFDAGYDHKLILWENDPLLKIQDMMLVSVFETALQELGISSGLVIVPCIPTAENLAKHWYGLLSQALQGSGFQGRLTELKVWETPTSLAVYMPDPPGSYRTEMGLMVNA